MSIKIHKHYHHNQSNHHIYQANRKYNYLLKYFRLKFYQPKSNLKIVKYNQGQNPELNMSHMKEPLLNMKRYVDKFKFQLQSMLQIIMLLNIKLNTLHKLYKRKLSNMFPLKKLLKRWSITSLVINNNTFNLTNRQEALLCLRLLNQLIPFNHKPYFHKHPYIQEHNPTFHNPKFIRTNHYINPMHHNNSQLKLKSQLNLKYNSNNLFNNHQINLRPQRRNLISWRDYSNDIYQRL